MSALFLLLGVSIIIAISFLIAFIWSVTTGQYDDEFTPSVRILFEDDRNKKSKNDQSTIEKKSSHAN